MLFYIMHNAKTLAIIENYKFLNLLKISFYQYELLSNYSYSFALIFSQVFVLFCLVCFFVSFPSDLVAEDVKSLSG